MIAMTRPYQILPDLTSDDFRRLKESILERGVQVPVVVDEDGNIIDGHHRAMIADSLGVEYPKVVRTGLNQSEKRILAAELNIARRHMTDAQKVKLGQDIEPDIAKEANRRQSHGQTAPGKNASGHVSGSVGETRDEVARIVGIGSGRTYERGKEVLDLLRKEPDGNQLIQHVDDGDWTLEDARTELRSRHPQRREPDPVLRTFEPRPLFESPEEQKPDAVHSLSTGMSGYNAASLIVQLNDLPTADIEDAASYLIEMKAFGACLDAMPSIISTLEAITRSARRKDDRKRNAS